MTLLIRNRFGVSVIKIITHFYKEYFVKYKVLKYLISFLRSITCLFQEIYIKCCCSLLEFFCNVLCCFKGLRKFSCKFMKKKVYFNKNVINVWFVLLLELKDMVSFAKSG